MNKKNIFITGATGYVGRALIPELLNKGHFVKALVRKNSVRKINANCQVVVGDPLDENSFCSEISHPDTFIQLVGVSHPKPSKARQFKEVDFVSAKASISSAKKNRIAHFIYVSVAQPAPIMKAYAEVRGSVEKLIVESNLNATILCPWYILGPGHRWPYFLIPVYIILKSIPSTKETARRLDLISLKKFIDYILHCVENPTTGVSIIEVPAMKKFDKKVDIVLSL
jgi:uncharacterized protein YbjT (DUF2867 family)